MIIIACNDTARNVAPEEDPVVENMSPEEQSKLVTGDGAGIFNLSAPIPRELEDYEIEKTTGTRLAEGMEIEETLFTISKNGEKVLILKPQFDPMTGKFNDKIGEIIILSEDFKTKEGIGVNSTLEEFLKTYPESEVWFTYVSDRYVVESPEMEAQFILNKEDFTGEVEINSAQVTLKPSDFKQGARIEKIRLY